METKESLNKLDQVVLSTDLAIDCMLRGGSLEDCEIANEEESKTWNKYKEDLCNNLYSLNNNIIGHEKRINKWSYPVCYEDIDLKSFLLSKCTSNESQHRVKTEYALYEEKNLLSVLRFFIFLVDFMREKNIVWGVGRGSSVSSYILYLIGLHKVDSIKYNLDITEFLKD